MTSFFNDLFEYNLNANSQVISKIQNHPESYSEKAATLLCHTLNAHHIWNSRILGIISEYRVWELHSAERLNDINQQNFNTTNTILNVEDLEKSIGYKNSKGIDFQNSIHDVLFHIVNHSTYHRGQLVSELKNQGVVPISSDYIFYKR